MGNVACKMLSSFWTSSSKRPHSLWSRLTNKARALWASVINHKEVEYVSSSIFPPEVTIEILSRLSLKSLAKFQLVCKEWRAIVGDHYFIEKHMSRRAVVTLYYNRKPRTVDEPLNERTSLVHGCDGLLILKCLTSPPKYYILNPATGSVLVLPNPHSYSHRLLISYVPTTQNYRIVSIYDDKETGREGCEVFIPGKSKAWRKLKFPDIVERDGAREKQKISVVLIGATVYCLIVVKVDSDIFEVLMSLDIGTECFTVTPLPSGVFKDWKTVCVLDWDGKLAFADIVGDTLQLMELDDSMKFQRKKTIGLPFFKEQVQIGGGNFYILFAKKGPLWFWLQKKKIVTYSIETGRVNDVIITGTFASDNNPYLYKPSLITFQGMVPDTKFHRLWLRNP